MATNAFDVVIVGAGHGGAQAAIALRQCKFEGTIVIVGEEPYLPYQRPPLSKAYLSGETQFDRILIRPARFWEERRVRLLLGSPVVSVDANAREVRTGTGEGISFGTLIWAAGGSPRRLSCSGSELQGLHVVRSRLDVDRMRVELDATTRVAVIGGGYIGLEAAAALTDMGKQVTIIESLDRVLSRVAGEPLSRFYEDEHRARGVRVLLGARVANIEGREGRVCGVRLEGGESIAAELIVAGIGVAPSIEPLVAAGAAVGNGVFVDGQGRTSLADVFAIGDCAAHANAFAGGATIRLESVQNATDQANLVGKVLTGHAESYRAMPWFWSDQYDLKLQTIGLCQGHDQLVLRGVSTRSFSIVYLKDGRVIALDCVNAPKDFGQGRALIASGVRPDSTALANRDVNLKSLASGVNQTLECE